MRTLKTAVCMECDAEALLDKLGVRTLAVCQTFKDLITLLGYRPDVIVAAGPADLADRIRARELATYPAVIFTQAQPEGRLNCLHASLSPESLGQALWDLRLGQQRAPDGAREAALDLLTQLGVAEGLGRDMLLEAILFAYLNRKLLEDMMGGLYALVGERFQATAVYAKQRIYRAIERAWTRGNVQAQYDLFLNTIDDRRAKPTNTEMIALIADILRLEGYEWRTSNG